jgi:MSV199 domain/Protein of unknown function (DUF3627)
VSPMILDFFGYEGSHSDQKKTFIKLLRSNEIAYQELTTKDDLSDYPTIQKEIDQLANKKGPIANSKWLIMNSRDLKLAIMQLKTKNGNMIREYYVDLEDLVKCYVTYQSVHKERQSREVITSLEEKIDKMQLGMQEQTKFLTVTLYKLDAQSKKLEKLDTIEAQNVDLLHQNSQLLDQAEQSLDMQADLHDKLDSVLPDRAIHPIKKGLQDQFTLIKRTRLVNDRSTISYYVIRGQKSHTNDKINDFRREFDSVVILLVFAKTPNSIALFNLAKKDMRDKGEIATKWNVIHLLTISEMDLIERLEAIDDSRLIV